MFEDTSTTYDMTGMQVSIRLKFTFTCTNTIDFEPGVQRTLSNHTYTLDINVKSRVNEMGLATDFNDIQDIYTQYIAPKLEGQLIHETLPLMHTTAEQLAYWLWCTFETHLASGDILSILTLYETPNQGISLTKEMVREWRRGL